MPGLSREPGLTFQAGSIPARRLTPVGVAWYAGLVITSLGLWNMVQPLAGTKLDNVLRAPMARIGHIMVLAVIVRYYGEPLFKHWGKLAKPSLGWDFLRFLTSATFSWESSSGSS